MKHILFEKNNGIGLITLNSPKQRNALSLELMNEMQKQLEKISKSRDIKVVVIKGNGPAFCTGHNLKELVGKNYGITHFRKVFLK